MLAGIEDMPVRLTGGILARAIAVTCAGGAQDEMQTK
jgi:hypothetical protein